ncbi:ribonuclease H-like domain-containing protein [Rhizophagus irregularis DAOM 181602=DAOM 197198]|nr:ribonuclease H-like domain-containing protein [Rhizophagus irregularis DAOM 181602=DAOM 197198]
MLNGLTVLCKTQYQFSRKVTVKYTIERVDENGQKESRYSLSSAGAASSLFLNEICNKPTSRVFGTILFRFDISFLQQLRETIAQQSPITPANRKQPFNELTSRSQKNKQISMVGKDIAAQTMKILKENRFTSTSEEIITTVESIILRINGEIVELHFDFNNAADDDIKYLDSIVRACDETLISRDGIAINNYGDENIIVPILATSTSPVLKIGNKINIRISGDGRNVGRKQKHVMLTMCIINEGEMVLNPTHQYSICLYIGKESYDSLSTVSAIFSQELEQLKTNGYKASNNTIWPVEFFFQMKRLHIHFEFYLPTTKNGKWEWTSLMALQNNSPKSITDLEIDQFEADAKQWIHNFCRPTIGTMNSANQQQGMYLCTDVSPYMHVFAQHVPQFMRYLNQKGMVLRYFSTSIHDILYYENRQLYYQMQDTPIREVRRVRKELHDWDHYFKEPLSSEHYKARCHYCNQNWFKEKPEILKSHLALYCKDVPLYIKTEYMEMLAVGTTFTMNRKQKTDSDSSAELTADRKDKIDQALIRFFICCGIPFSTIGHPYFINFVQSLCFVYGLPKRTTISTTFLNHETAIILNKIKEEPKYEKNLTLAF